MEGLSSFASAFSFAPTFAFSFAFSLATKHFFIASDEFFGVVEPFWGIKKAASAFFEHQLDASFADDGLKNDAHFS